MAKSKGKKKIIFFSLLALVIIAAVVYGQFAKRVPPISITKEKAARRNLTEEVVANGKIEPVLEVKISPEVSGEIIELDVKEGQHVKKGDLLLKIRPDNYVAARDSAKANFKFAAANKNTADANLEKAFLEFKRNEALFQAKLISDSDFLTAKTTYDVAKTTLAGAVEQVSIAQAQLNSAEADLSKTVIYSPLDGTISKLNSQLGERVVGTGHHGRHRDHDCGQFDQHGGPRGHGRNGRAVDRRWPEGPSGSGFVQGPEIQRPCDRNCQLGQQQRHFHRRRITSTDATKFQVKIHITDKEAFLPGMSVTADIETRYRTNVLTVPIQSVTTRLPKDKSGGTNAAANEPCRDRSQCAGHQRRQDRCQHQQPRHQRRQDAVSTNSLGTNAAAPEEARRTAQTH